MEIKWQILFPPDKETVDGGGTLEVRRAGAEKVLACGNVRKNPISGLYQYFHGNMQTALLEDADFYKLEQKVIGCLLRKYSQPDGY